MILRRPSGFSLFELIVVIAVVVLVIYAGLPHFEKALQETHATAVRLNARAFQEGVSRAKVIQMLDGLNGPVYNLPRFGDGTLDLSVGGFPAGTSRKPGDQLTAQHCAEIWSAILEPNPEQTRGGVTSSFTVALEKTGKMAVCSYIYVHGGRMGIRYNPDTGAVTADATFKGFAF